MSGGELDLSEIRVRRGGRTTLDIQRLRIPSGTFAGIIGTNGAGKTTLLKVCAGLLKSAGGSVLVDGVDLARLGAWAKCRVRKRIGYIPQSVEYNAELPFTVGEVVAMGRTSTKPLLARLGREDRVAADRWIETLGLADQRDQTFRSLSGGEQQKALIARAMAQEPEILMLDEPCANLDFRWKHEISEIVERLYRQTEMTVVMVSHETGVLPSACERIVLMAEGRVVADGEPDAVLSPDTLGRAYEGRFRIVGAEGRRYALRVASEADR